MINIDFRHEAFIFHKPNWCSLIDNYFRHKTPCGIRKLTAAFVSKIGVFSRFFLIARFRRQNGGISTLVLQIWRSRKRVPIQIQLMNIHVSECKYYCLHLVPKFGDMCDRQNWRLHPTGCPDVNKLRGMDTTILGQHRPFMSIKSFVQHSGWQEMVSLCSLIRLIGVCADRDQPEFLCSRSDF